MKLNGVRQCGKTYILKEFGRAEFDNLAYVSCDRNENLQAIYEGDFDTARIIRGLSALTGVDIIPGKTLICPACRCVFSCRQGSDNASVPYGF